MKTLIVISNSLFRIASQKVISEQKPDSLNIKHKYTAATTEANQKELFKDYLCLKEKLILQSKTTPLTNPRLHP